MRIAYDARYMGLIVAASPEGKGAISSDPAGGEYSPPNRDVQADEQPIRLYERPGESARSLLTPRRQEAFIPDQAVGPKSAIPPWAADHLAGSCRKLSTSARTPGSKCPLSLATFSTSHQVVK